MPDNPTEGPDRRTVLRRGAAIGVGVWSVPIIQSVTNPAAAGSLEPDEVRCLKQSFTQDAQGQALTYTPGRERRFNVDLNATFSEITMIYVRLYESSENPVDSTEHGAVLFRFADGGAGGVIFFGSATDPITLGFGPGAGRGQETYASLLMDGTVELIVEQSSESPGSFILTRVEIEVCGTVA